MVGVNGKCLVENLEGTQYSVLDSVKEPQFAYVFC